MSTSHVKRRARSPISALIRGTPDRISTGKRPGELEIVPLRPGAVAERRRNRTTRRSRRATCARRARAPRSTSRGSSSGPLRIRSNARVERRVGGGTGRNVVGSPPARARAAGSRCRRRPPRRRAIPQQRDRGQEAFAAAARWATARRADSSTSSRTRRRARTAPTSSRPRIIASAMSDDVELVEADEAPALRDPRRDRRERVRLRCFSSARSSCTSRMNAWKCTRVLRRIADGREEGVHQEALAATHAAPQVDAARHLRGREELLQRRLARGAERLELRRQRLAAGRAPPPARDRASCPAPRAAAPDGRPADRAAGRRCCRSRSPAQCRDRARARSSVLLADALPCGSTRHSHARRSPGAGQRLSVRPSTASAASLVASDERRMRVADPREVLARRAELHRDDAFGDQLRRVRADDVHAEDAIGGSVGQDLDEAAWCRPRPARGRSR